MAECNAAKTLDNAVLEGYDTDVMTGDRDKRRYLYYQLIHSMRKAERIDIIVSFLMESDVKMLLEELEKAMKRGAKVRILTGNYLGITQPSALYLIKHELGELVDLRFYNEKNRSFHPKSYIFHYSDHSEIYIGSSNISRSALTSGIEWNYRFSSNRDPENYEKFYRTFEDLFQNQSIVIDDKELKRYSKTWHRPAASKDLDRYDNAEEEEDTKVRLLFEPRGAQIEALCALENSRAEGASRGIVQAATGVGKTYLAAFDSRNYQNVLFVAHREEILNQAAVSFREKYFPKDYFDYIVIDEFHHAVNNQYLQIVNYFKPKFLLGLTATPERMDGRNIYEICDYNVPYEISLGEAINKGMLVPFRYYGIYDDTDYSKLHVVKGHYTEKELNETYLGNVHRHELIYKYYNKYGSKRALGFCSTREHAEEMAMEFSKRGIPSAAVYSGAPGAYAEERNAAIEKLKSGEIRVIFSVDMFNEGVDIPSVDMVLFLRPTESPVVFLQQLGRGLRRSAGKEYLTVLDFIGNYEKAGNVRRFLTGNAGSAAMSYRPSDQEGIPDDCLIDFDMRLIDLFAEMDKRQLRIRDQIQAEYFRVKEKLGRRPSRMDLFTYMDDDVYQLALSHTKDNIFRDYLGFLHLLGETTEMENELLQGIAKEFLNILETTSMTKVYKMPVLMAFYNDGDIQTDLTAPQLLQAWKQFFDQNRNWKDLDKQITYEKYKAMPDKEHLKKIISMPVHFLLESGKGFFEEKDGCVISLRSELQSWVKNEALKEQMKDIVEYRAMDYYRRRYRETR